MGTRGFVGFSSGGEIKGFYNHFDSYYSSLGMNALSNYAKHSLEELKDFFLNRVDFVCDDPDDKYYENHRTIWNIDWKNDSIMLQDGTDFLWDGLFCEFGYVYNLDNDTVDVYRGFFKFEQNINQPYRESGGNKFYTHHVLTITRDNIGIIGELFKDSGLIYDKYEGNPYYELAYLRDSEAVS